MPTKLRKATSRYFAEVFSPEKTERLGDPSNIERDVSPRPTPTRVIQEAIVDLPDVGDEATLEVVVFGRTVYRDILLDYLQVFCEIS